MSNHEWRWADPTGQQRLVRTDELRAALASGVIPANAPVWRRGWPGWKPAHDVPELSTSALAAANGVLLAVPPPPLFVVAAQSEFEDKDGGPDDAALEEPPSPPRYEPMKAPAPPSVPPPVPAKVETKVEPKVEAKPAPKPEPSPKPAIVVPKPQEPTAKPPAAKAKDALKIPPAPIAKPATRPAMVPAAPAGGTSPKPPPIATRPASPPGPPAGSEIRSIPTMRGIPVIPDPTKVPKIEMPHGSAAAARPATSPKPAPVAADAPSSLKRATLPVFPAPPPMTKVEDSAPPPELAPKAPPAEPALAPLPSRNPTLIQFGGAPESTPPPAAATAPINVPPPEPSEVTGGSVTRPPPWGEGSVGIEPDIPKHAPAPQIAPENVEELSGSMLLPDAGPPPVPLRPHELSSSDLTSEADIPVAKPPPLAPADKRGGTLGTPAPPLVSPNAATAVTAKMPPVAPRVEPPSDPDAAVEPEAEPDEDLSAPPLAPTVPKRSSIPPEPPAEEHVPARAAGDWQQSLRDKPPWMLAGGGALAVLVVLGLGSLVAKVAGGSSDAPTSSASAAPTNPPSATAATASASAVPTVAPPIATKDVACTVTADEKTIATHTMIASGVEARAAGGGIALGFASTAKEATLTIVDPTTLAAGTTTHGRSADPVRRVVALSSGIAIDVDRKGDKLQGRRAVAGDPAIDLGSDGSNLAWAPHGTDKTIALFPLGGTGPVEALRGERAGSTGFVAFRQGTSIYVGAWAGDPLVPSGSLAKLDGLGPKVGSPALAVRDGTAFVVWADRAADAEPWGLRWVVVRAGKAPSAPKKFGVPAGGLGEHAMSPGVAALGPGRWLLSWTEGPTSSHQVRAVVVDDDGVVHGSALTVSAEGVNAGQGQAAVGSDGKGVVAFLAGSGKNFDVVARGIACTEK